VGTTIEMATTEEKCPGAGSADEHATPAEGPRGERRRRAHELLATQRSHLDRLENELTEQLQHLAEEVAQSVHLAETVAGQAGESEALAALQAQFDALKRQFDALDAESDQLRKQLEEAELERGRAEQELRVRDALLKEAQSHDEARRVELATHSERLADAEARLAAAHQRQNALEAELAQVHEQVAQEQEKTKAQRRRIARDFKQQRAEWLAELDRRKAELEALGESRQDGLDEQLAAAQAELSEKLRETDELRASLAQLNGEVEHARHTIEHMQAEHAREVEQLGAGRQPGADPVASHKLREERDGLVKRLAAAENRLKEQATSGELDARQKDDLQRRFEMAVEEVRELKRVNGELETKLKSRAGSTVVAAGGGLDWEAQKQRLLASLEADDGDEETAAERTSIEGTIRITDQIVAQKDRELAELKLLLENHSGSADAGSAAVNELLDRDELVRREREKLVQAQEEWREKIGKAEIDISVERAKIARERAELEDKIRQYQADQERRDDAADPNKPTRGRWLARLGLKDLDEPNEGRGKGSK
jgi:DNA repair exonuclease SbcCD ATPase subunit